VSVQVGVYNIGGDIPVAGNLDYESASWTHVVNDFGTAIITLNACDDIALNFHPFVHEIRITDDGELAFAGPIRYVVMPMQAGGKMEIIAYDLAYWLQVRHTHLDVDFTGTGTFVSDVVGTIVVAALSPSPVGVELSITECPVVHDRIVKPFELAWQNHLASIVGTLMNMSVHGRTLHFWCIDECIGILPNASTSDFVNFNSLVRDGDTFTTSAALIGEGTVLGTAGGVHPVWPVLVERTITDTTYLNDASATAAAAAMISERAKMTFGENDLFTAELNCNGPWPLTRVIPGACTLIASPYGVLQLSVRKTISTVQGGVITRSIGFKEI